ncbi:MAG: universal stress protein [Thermodesulfobacteriota bacterium]
MKIQLKKVLCATDLSELSDYAVRYSIALAREFDSELLMCHVIDLTAGHVYGEGTISPLDQQNRIEEFAYAHLNELMGQTPIIWEPLVKIGHAPDEIATIAEERQVDLVISATHARAGFKRLVLGSVTGRLMGILPCPLLIVPNGKQHSKNDINTFTPKRILVGCDFSPDSDLAFEYGLGLAQEFQSELHLIHVIEPPTYKDSLKSGKTTEKSDRPGLHAVLEERLDQMVSDEARYWCTPKTVLLAGRPHEELTKYAVVNDMELVVMGVRGHSLMETLFVGSTTDRVARQAPCPILSVRPLKSPSEGTDES